MEAYRLTPNELIAKGLDPDRHKPRGREAALRQFKVQRSTHYSESFKSFQPFHRYA
jgi:hypothetical protein